MQYTSTSLWRGHADGHEIPNRAGNTPYRLVILPVNACTGAAQYPSNVAASRCTDRNVLHRREAVECREPVVHVLLNVRRE